MLLICLTLGCSPFLRILHLFFVRFGGYLFIFVEMFASRFGGFADWLPN